MLPAKARLRRQADFADTIRQGRRSGRPALVVSLLTADGAHAVADPARVGFVVGRRVGGAVVRNRIRRRLRHLLADRLGLLPSGSRVVVRVLPGAERLPASELSRELDTLLTRVVR
jgi:ribonuclease P protein component